MHLRNVLFDFDGTLANTLPLTIFAMKKMFQKYDGRSVSADDLVAMFGPPEHLMIKNNLQNQAALSEATELYYQLYEREHDDYVEKNEAIMAMLRLLKEREIKIGVVTGKSRRSYIISEEKMAFHGLFDSVITGDDVTVSKPDPEGILRTLEQFKAKPDESIYIGDANSDIIAGKAAGIHTAAVQWLEMPQSSTYPAGPEFYWTKISQFTNLLA